MSLPLGQFEACGTLDAETLYAESIAAAAPDVATTVECEVVRAIDGDTVEVVVKQRYRVRLIDCWAPELSTGAPGDESKRALETFIGPMPAPAVLSVPWHEQVGKQWSMGRVVGNVWIKNTSASLSEAQVASGHATRIKHG